MSGTGMADVTEDNEPPRPRTPPPAASKGVPTGAPLASDRPAAAPAGPLPRPEEVVFGVPTVTAERMAIHITPAQLEAMSTGFMVLGAGMVALGLVAVATPLLFSIVIEQFLGALFVVGGAVTLIHGIQLCGVNAPACTTSLVLGLVHLLVGLWLLNHPTEGLAGLVLVLGAWFTSNGVIKLFMSYQLRHVPTWPSILISGLLSLVLGGLILAQWPSNSGWVVGLLVGIELVVTGFSLLLISTVAKTGAASRQETLSAPLLA